MKSLEGQLDPGRIAAGSEFAGYRIEGILGRQTGTGRVYRAKQESGEPVALKVFAPPAARDLLFRQRFEEMAELQSELAHPNVAMIDDLGTSPAPYLAMTLIQGKTLPQLIESERLDGRRLLSLLAPIADALDFAYRHFGLVYRRLQPSSIIVAKENGRDHAYLADFGAGRPSHSTQLIESRRLGAFADYISPEEVQGAEPDLPSSVYSLASILYEGLTGEPPHLYEESWEVLRAHLEERPRPLRALRPDLSSGLETALAKGLAKEPARRYRSPNELMAAVRYAYPAAASSSDAGGKRPVAASSAAGAVAADSPAKRQPKAGTARGGLARRLLRPLPLATYALMLLAAFLGAALAGSGDSGTDAARASGTGALELRHPADWRKVRVASPLPGVPLTDSLALAPGGRPEQGTLVAGRAADGSSAAEIQERLAELGAEQRPDRVQLGRVQALRVTGVRPSGLGEALSVYLVPTTAAPVILACAPRGPAGGFAASCEAAASTLRLRGAQPVSLGASRAYVSGVEGLVSRLNSRRSRQRRQLRAARTARGQVAATRALTGSYRQAARSAGGLLPPPGLQPAHTRLRNSLQATAARYREMTAAARKRDRGAWNAARARVRSSEAEVRSSLRTLRRLIAA